MQTVEMLVEMFWYYLRQVICQQDMLENYECIQLGGDPNRRLPPLRDR